ncbi:MAG TPA: O-antigen polymerase [Dehalococcoidia bacterium]
MTALGLPAPALESGRARVAPLAAAAAAAALGGVLALLHPRTETALIGAIAAVAVLPLLWRAAQRRLDPFEPLLIFSVAWLVLFVARPAAMLLTDAFRFQTYPIRDGFIPMLVMALLGGAGFLLGYALPWGGALGRRLPPLPSAWHADTAVAYALALVGLGTVLFTAFLLQAGGPDLSRSLLEGRGDAGPDYAASTGYLYLAIFLSIPAALLIIASGGMTGRLRRGLVALGIAVLCVSLVQAGPSGTRSWLLPIFGSVFIFWYVRHGRRPAARTLLLLLLMGFFLGINFAREARSPEVRREVGLWALLVRSVTRPDDAWDAFILGPDTEMASLLSLEATAVPSRIPFQHGLATGHVLVHPVPRTLWPGKPRPGDEILTEELFHRRRINFAPRQYTPLGNFYMDFGYAGALAGMAPLGVLARLHYAYFLRNAANPAVQALFAATLPFWVVLLRGSVSDTAARLFYVVPPLLLGLALARRAGGSAPPEAAP